MITQSMACEITSHVRIKRSISICLFFQEMMIFPIGVINNFYYAISSKKRTKTSHEVHEISLWDNRIFLNNNWFFYQEWIDK